MLRTPLTRKLRGPIDEEKIARIWREIRRRRARWTEPWRNVLVLAAVSVGLGLSALLVVLITRREPLPSRVALVTPLSLSDGSPLRAAIVAERAVPAVWALSDGSELSFEPGTEWEPLAVSSTQFVSSLRRGSTTFEVKPGGPRRWLIDAGPVQVEVVGTRFSVKRDAARVVVTVARGVVLVRGEKVPDEVQRLTAGQSLEVALASPSPEVAPSASSEAPVAPGAAPRPTWLEKQRSGHFKEAYEDLGESGVARETLRTWELGRLLALADIAKLSGHPAEAVAPLERLIENHGDRPEGAIAAITLGRLCLDQLARPAAAAAALERALALGPPRGLREDVRARLVEAYARDGNRTAAERALADYDREFPASARRNVLLNLVRDP